MLHLGGFIRPAENRHGPQGRRKPRIQYIRVLYKVVAAAHRAFFRFVKRNNRLGTVLKRHFSQLFAALLVGGKSQPFAAAVAAVPNGDTVPPPNLAGNTPILNIVKPI